MSVKSQRNGKYLRRDSAASLLMGPVSLMLALGLAMVAHAPFEAGIIAVVIGGLVVSNLGGSFVNISGPGVHSAAVWMMGAIILGKGDFTFGYDDMLAVSIVSGVAVAIVGVTRKAFWLDFLPVSVRRGIISLLGVWIVLNQLPPMLGASAFTSYNSVGEMISTYPQLLAKAVAGANDYLITGLGLLALVFMIIYSSYQNRLIRTLPAPIWLFIGGIAAAFYLQVYEGDAFLLNLDQQVDLPSIGIGWLTAPSFALWKTLDFWAVATGLFLVSWNESVLNLRSTDRLDTQHRRTDVNRELMALGVATILSSSIGGMNVTATVAQSSTNVQLKAVSRWSNTFNAVVVALLVILGGAFVEQLMIPVIAAMMLYIGYRMAAPAHMRTVAEIGWEAFVGYAVAFVIGWVYGIVYGLLLGVLVIFLLQVITSGKGGYILRFAFRPNSMLYQEEDGGYLLSIKHYANFMNLGRLRQKLDSVPSSAELIVDCSLAQFVDYNVQVQLEYYEEIFMRRGGRFEIVGLDDLPVRVHHDFASWMPFGSAPTDDNLSSRQEALQSWADEMEFQYNAGAVITGQPFYVFQYFRVRRIDSQRNRIKGKLNGLNFVLADIDFHQGEFIARGSTHATIMALQLPFKVPQFVLDKERLLDKVASMAGFRDINFSDKPNFSSQFKLQGANEAAIRSFFTPELIDLLVDSPQYHIEGRGNQLLIFEKERLAGVNEMKDMVSFAEDLASFLKASKK